MEAKKTGDSCHCSNMQWQELLIEEIDLINLKAKGKIDTNRLFLDGVRCEN